MMAPGIGYQGSLFGAGEPIVRAPLPPFESLDTSSRILFAPDWLAGSDGLFERLVAELPWRTIDRPMYDRIVAVPRLICTLGRRQLQAGDALGAVWDQLSDELETDFTHMGANLYRDGADSVAWHADNVATDPAATTVALLSLGSRRQFKMRSGQPDSGRSARSWHLGSGDLFVMAGACQRDWEHCVPKARTACPRISLAFRTTKR